MTPQLVTTYICLKDSFKSAARGDKPVAEILELKRMVQDNGGLSFKFEAARCPDAPVVISVQTYSTAAAEKIASEAGRNASVERSWMQ